MERHSFSRWMPPNPSQPLTRRGAAVLGCMGLGLLGLAYWYVPFRYALAIMVCAVLVESTRLRRRMRRLAAQRQGEGICTFARSFGRRGVDPWIIRAVYDELQSYADAGGVPVPIRATDPLYEVFGIDGEELDDVAQRVAERAGRSLEGGERNPEVPVTTVGGLVRFFARQPRTADG